MRAITLGALAAWAAAAQAPVIHTESRLVLVDAVVIDRAGRPVADLAANNFRIWEDGREQPVRSARFGGAGASYVVLFFDDASLDIGAGKRVREAAVRFVDANAGPGHWMAIADFGSTLRNSQNFTGDSERLKRVLLETHPLPPQPIRGLGAAVPVPGAFGRGGLAGRLGQMAEAADRDLSALGAAVRALAINLADVPGRKTVVLFTASSPLASQSSPAFAGAIVACNRWNVAVDPVAAGGNDLPAPFHDLARNTGGLVSAHSRDLDQELEGLRRETNGYYTLSYVPAETPDGSCHNLRVKVDRPGAAVRARSLYCNVKAVDLLAGTPLEKELNARAAGDQPGKLAVSLQAPYFYTEPNVARLHLAMEIPAGNLPASKVKGKPHLELQILALAVQPDGIEVARFSDTVKLDSEPPESLHYEGQFEVPSGRYTLRVVVSGGGDSFARMEQALAIDAYDGKGLMLGGLALSKQIRPASDADAQLLEGVTPLTYQNLRLVPSGDHWLRKGETAAIYGEVYEASPAPVELRLRLVDLASGAVTPAGSTRVEAYRPGEFVALPFALKLDSLAPGRYRAEVEAAGAPVRSLEFEVR
jgi:VWFA-related protein